MRQLVLLLASLVVAPAAVAQDPPRFPSDVELVYVTLYAHDAQGRPVTDLAAGDLQVKEDGKVRPVSVLAAAGESASPEQTAVDACVLVDTSGSVSAVTEQLTRSALEVLGGLPRLRRRCVISFDNDVRVWHPEAEPAELVRDIMAARNVTGATALNTALVTALNQLGAGPGRGVVFLISDGDDVGSRVSQADVLAAVQASRAVIYPITYAAPPSVSLSPGSGVGNRPLMATNNLSTWNASMRYKGPAYLSRLAETTGGRVFQPGDGDVEGVLAHIAAEVSAQYVVGFAPASAYTGPHKLKLAVSRKDVKIRYRPSFVVAEPARR